MRPHPKRPTVAAGLALLVLLLGIAPCLAQVDQPPGAPAAPQTGNPLVALLPALGRAAAPDWVREGLRVTYYSGVASVLGNYLAGPRDQEPVDPNTPTAGSGASFAQYDLVALDQAEAVSFLTFYLIDPTTRQVMPAVLLEDVGVPGAGATWVNPGVLATVQNQEADGTRITRLPYTIEGKTYQAIAFEYMQFDPRNVPVARTNYVYELATGLLLRTSTAIYSAFSRQTQLSHMEYRGQRYLTIPWQGGTVPEWVRPGHTMQFDGAYTTLLPGSPAIPLAARQTVQVVDRKGRWSRHRSQYAAGSPATADATTPTGVRQFLRGYWLPPEALAVLTHTGQLDADPITGAVVSVTGVGADERGNQVVQITEQCGGMWTSLNYDRRTGELVSMAQDAPVGIATTQLRLYRNPTVR